MQRITNFGNEYLTHYKFNALTMKHSTIYHQFTANFRHIIYTIVLFVPIATLGANPSDEENPYIILMGEADKAIAAGNYEEAAARLIDALGVEPDNPANMILKTNLSMVYSALGRDSLALATIDDVILHAPKMTVARVNRGKLNLKANRNDSAFADFSKAIEMDSVNVDARYFRGMMSLYDGNLALAEADFNVLEAKYPKRKTTLIALSTLYSMSGRDLQAIDYLKQLIEVEPAPENYSTLAGCYLALDNLSEASTTISEGLEKFPIDPELYYYRAILNRRRYRYDEAREDAYKALKYGADPKKVKEILDAKKD